MATIDEAWHALAEAVLKKCPGAKTLPVAKKLPKDLPEPLAPALRSRGWLECDGLSAGLV